jgi:hypothetical protein
VWFPVEVEVIVWSFLGGDCGDDLLQAYLRAFDLCCDVALWLLRRLPLAIRFEASLVEEIWPRAVPRATEGAGGGLATARLRSGLSGALQRVVDSALAETPTWYEDGPDWTDWVWVELQWDFEDDDFCETMASLFAGLRPFVFGRGFVETRKGGVYRSGLRCGYLAAFGAVLAWCRFLLKETEKITQAPDGPGSNIPREILDAARLCYRLTWPQTES